MPPHFVVEEPVFPELGPDPDPEGKPGMDRLQEGAVTQHVPHFHRGLTGLRDDLKAKWGVVLGRQGGNPGAQESQEQEKYGSSSGQGSLRIAD